MTIDTVELTRDELLDLWNGDAVLLGLFRLHPDGWTVPFKELSLLAKKHPATLIAAIRRLEAKGLVRVERGHGRVTSHYQACPVGKPFPVDGNLTIGSSEVVAD